MIRRPVVIPEDEEAWLSWVVDYATRVARPAWRIYHTRYSKGSHAGFPDLVMVRPPRLVFVELKTDSPRSKPTRAQEDWLDDLHLVASLAGRADPEGTCGIIGVYVWRPADRPDIERILR